MWKEGPRNWPVWEEMVPDLEADQLAYESQACWQRTWEPWARDKRQLIICTSIVVATALSLWHQFSDPPFPLGHATGGEARVTGTGSRHGRGLQSEEALAFHLGHKLAWSAFPPGGGSLFAKGDNQSVFPALREEILSVPRLHGASIFEQMIQNKRLPWAVLVQYAVKQETHGELSQPQERGKTRTFLFTYLVQVWQEVLCTHCVSKSSHPKKD